MFVCLFSQGGQLVVLMPVLAACHLIYVFSVVLHCIHVVVNKVPSLSLSSSMLEFWPLIMTVWVLMSVTKENLHVK